MTQKKRSSYYYVPHIQLCSLLQVGECFSCLVQQFPAQDALKGTTMAQREMAQSARQQHSSEFSPALSSKRHFA